jgi:signal transduction histidine kinase
VAASFQIPDRFPGAAPWRSLICLSAVSIEGWSGRLFFVNPAQPVSDDQQLRFLQTTWQQVRPAVVNIDLLRRLRSRLDELNAARLEAVSEKTRLEAVMDVLPTGLAITDARGGSIQSNAAFGRIWGAGRPTTARIADYAAYKAWWLDTGREVQPEEWASARAIRLGETVTGQVMEIERFDGDRAFVLNSAAPIVDANGKVTGSVVAIQDVTRRIEVEHALARSEAALKHSNEQLQAANEALRRSNETLEARVAERTSELARRTTQLQALAGDLTRAEERERQRIAQVIHDHLQQLLSVARIKLGMVLRQAGATPPHEALRDADGLIAESLDITRSLTADLSPAILHRSGLAAALQWLGRWYADRYTLNVAVEADGNPEVAEEIRVTLFRAVRELLFNVVKHAQVRNARVELGHDADSRIRIVVSDDGAGFDPDLVRAREGTAGSFGLFSLRERLESLGGQLEVDSAPGRGASIVLLGPPSGT